MVRVFIALHEVEIVAARTIPKLRRRGSNAELAPNDELRLPRPILGRTSPENARQTAQVSEHVR